MFLFSFALMAVAYRSPFVFTIFIFFTVFMTLPDLRYEYVYYTVGDEDVSKGEKNSGFEAEESDEKGNKEEKGEGE